MIIDRSLPCTELEKLHAEREAAGLEMCDRDELMFRCEDALRKSLELTHENFACYADDLVRAQFNAMQSVLEDTIAYLEDMEDAMEIAEYARDPADATGRQWPEEDGMYADDYEEEEAKNVAA